MYPCLISLTHQRPHQSGSCIKYWNLKLINNIPTTSSIWITWGLQNQNNNVRKKMLVKCNPAFTRFTHFYQISKQIRKLHSFQQWPTSKHKNERKTVWIELTELHNGSNQYCKDTDLAMDMGHKKLMKLRENRLWRQ